MTRGTRAILSILSVAALAATSACVVDMAPPEAEPSEPMQLPPRVPLVSYDPPQAPGVFLSVDGNDQNDGLSPQAPVHSYTRAVEVFDTWQAQHLWESKPFDLYVAEGTYFETFVVHDFHMHGGFSKDFNHRDPAEHVTVVESRPALLAPQSNWVRDVEVDGFVFEAPSLCEEDDPACEPTGESAIAVRFENTQARIALHDNVIVAGRGAPGADGDAGAAGEDGSAGAPGGDVTLVNNLEAAGSGGADAQTGCGAGGAGGAGGGVNTGAQPGLSGLDGISTGGVHTAGGLGGQVANCIAYQCTSPFGVVLCGGWRDETDAGPYCGAAGKFVCAASCSATGLSAQSGTSVSAGEAGLTGDGLGEWIDGRWVGTDGEAGTPGNDGIPGAGGGGAGAYYFVTNEGGISVTIRHEGAGGGQGGSAGCAGSEGQAGLAGGGSFAIVVFDSPGVSIVDNQIQTADGARGGNGGNGGAGGAGGNGGAGGLSSFQAARNGGRGGAGSAGSSGGPGGGGSGGVSIGVFISGADLANITGNAFDLGNGGEGGLSGTFANGTLPAVPQAEAGLRQDVLQY